MPYYIAYVVFNITYDIEIKLAVILRDWSRLPVEWNILMTNSES